MASHDPVLLEVCAEMFACSEVSYEIEHIHGLVTPSLQALATSSGRLPRIYVPYGRGFLPSAVQVLRRNPRLGTSLVKAVIARTRVGRATELAA